MKKAVIYARYSSDKQTEQSIEGQIAVCKEFAKNNNIKIVDYYIDRAMSGTNSDRPDFLRMIKDSSAKKWDYVIVYKLDRFARSRYDSAVFNNALKKNGVTRLSATENITDSPEGMLLETVLEGLNEYYSLELSQKVKRGLRENLKKGKSIGGGTPYGYDIVEHKYQVNAAEAHGVKIIYEMYRDGKTVKEIMQYLNDNHIHNKSNKKFPKSSVYDILRNKKYIGIFEYENVVYDNIYPKLIDDDLFDAVQVILRENVKPRKNNNRDDFYLTGKLFYGPNLDSMRGTSGTSGNGNTYYYYILNKSKNLNPIKKDVLENFVYTIILNNILTKNHLDPIIASSLKTYNEERKNDVMIKSLKDKKKQIESELKNISKAVKKGIFSSTLQKDLEILEQELILIEAAINREEIEKPFLTKESIFFMFDLFKKKSKNPKFKEIVLNNFVNKVILTDDDYIIIICNIDPNKPYKYDINQLNSSDKDDMVLLTGSYPNILLRKNHIFLVDECSILIKKEHF